MHRGSTSGGRQRAGRPRRRRRHKLSTPHKVRRGGQRCRGRAGGRAGELAGGVQRGALTVPRHAGNYDIRFCRDRTTSRRPHQVSIARFDRSGLQRLSFGPGGCRGGAHSHAANTWRAAQPSWLQHLAVRGEPSPVQCRG